MLAGIQAPQRDAAPAGFGLDSVCAQDVGSIYRRPVGAVLISHSLPNDAPPQTRRVPPPSSERRGRHCQVDEDGALLPLEFKVLAPDRYRLRPINCGPHRGEIRLSRECDEPKCKEGHGLLVQYMPFALLIRPNTLMFIGMSRLAKSQTNASAVATCGNVLVRRKTPSGLHRSSGNRVRYDGYR